MYWLIDYIQVCILREFVVCKSDRAPRSVLGHFCHREHCYLLGPLSTVASLDTTVLWSGASVCVEGSVGRNGAAVGHSRRIRTMSVVSPKRNGVEKGGLTFHHGWQVPQGGKRWLLGPAEGGDSEGSQRAGWGWHDADIMGCLSRQLGRSAVDRVEGVGIYVTYAMTLNSVLRIGCWIWESQLFPYFCFYYYK